MSARLVLAFDEFLPSIRFSINKFRECINMACVWNILSKICRLDKKNKLEDGMKILFHVSNDSLEICLNIFSTFKYTCKTCDSIMYKALK